MLLKDTVTQKHVSTCTSSKIVAYALYAQSNGMVPICFHLHVLTLLHQLCLFCVTHYLKHCLTLDFICMILHDIVLTIV